MHSFPILLPYLKQFLALARVRLEDLFGIGMYIASLKQVKGICQYYICIIFLTIWAVSS